MANGAQNASGTPAPAASHSGGHVVSARTTTIGLMAILLWSFMAGTVRIVSENFGATLGSALIYTVGGILLLMFRRPAPIREFPKKYLIIGGLLFVFYESSISLSLGLASTDASSVEVSLVNYLWPTMMVLLSAGVSHRKHAVVKVLPGAIVATAGVVLAVGGNSGLDWHAAVQHIAANPLPYALAFVGALAWSVYAVFTPAMSHGVDGTSLFFPCVAVALWIIHFASGQGWPAEPPSLVAWLFVLIAAAAIGGGYACWGLWHSAWVYGAAGYCVLCHAGAVHRGQCGVAGFGAVAAVLVWRAAGGRRIGAQLLGQCAQIAGWLCSWGGNNPMGR